MLQQPTAASAQAGYANTATYGTPAAAIQQAAQQQQLAWSQQASAQGAQQADAQQGVYGRASTGVASVPASGASANAAGQYGGQYGAVYANPTQGTSQQVRLITIDASSVHENLRDIFPESITRYYEL